MNDVDSMGSTNGVSGFGDVGTDLSLALPTDWPEEFLGFRSLDDSFRCSICKDFYRAAMSLPCSHTFCSLCIRHHLTVQSECPTCRIQVQGVADMRPNKALDDCVAHFKLCRSAHLKKLTDLLQNRGTASVACGPSADIAPESTISPHFTQSTRHDTVPESSRSQAAGEARHSTRMQTRRFAQYGSNGDSSKPVEAADRPLENPQERLQSLQPQGEAAVTCPLCQKQTKAKDIDRHMDSACTYVSQWTVTGVDRSVGGFSPQSTHTSKRATTTIRRSKASVPYALYNDTKLRKLLKDEGLTTTGDRQTLIKRHTEWVKRYNANIDEGNPKSTKDILRDLKDWERTSTIAQPAPFTSTAGHEETRQTEAERMNHAMKYQHHYEDMIENLRKRKREGTQTG
ncbi:uncharacterized protein EV422DRAFT_525682 [Fimicolochytrium jonesii]|uniref:uncharacterized protein n=1 Tax=Fimicolochytrium jonesii TaxID=1396493 RepID=UPI0022FF3343|nr:uncharacterized protein EV422DRAFT_525682 [Fimicolochytrium jonesii]KAI8822110.1 hypothetical protein EV422DRAFT_525682 [Fimicolochytrium jonesii]